MSRMGRKRKSDLISKDDEIDIVDLTLAYGIDENESLESISTLPSPPKSDAKPAKLRSNHNAKVQQSNVQAAFNFTDAASQAAEALNDATRSTQSVVPQSLDLKSKWCKRCRQLNMPCGLQRPSCKRCQGSQTHKALTAKCEYPEEFSKPTEVLRKQSTQDDMEVIDLEDEDEDRDKDSNGGYEVEAILKRRWRYGIQYFVKWKGYPHNVNTWEPEGNLAGAKALIDEFEATNKKSLAGQRGKDDKLPSSQTFLEPTQSPDTAEIVIPMSPTGLQSQLVKEIPRGIDHVLACRLVPADGSYEYLVQWKDSTPVGNSWEPEVRFMNAQNLIRSYQLTSGAMLPDVKSKPTYEEAVDAYELSQGIQVIVCSRRNPASFMEYTFCKYHKIKHTLSWIASSGLNSQKAQYAVFSFVMASKIVQETSRDKVTSPAPLQSHRSINAGLQQVQAKTIATNGRNKTSVSREIPRSAGVVEIEAVINHKLRRGQSTEYLVRWKNHPLSTWLSTEEVSGLIGGVMAVQRYQANVEDSLSWGKAPAGLSINAQPTALDGRPVNGYRSKNAPASSAPASSKNDSIQPLGFLKPCVECKKAGLECEGNANCKRCTAIKLACSYAQPSPAGADAAWTRENNKMSQHVSHAVLNTKPRVNHASRQASSQLTSRSSISTSKAGVTVYRLGKELPGNDLGIGNNAKPRSFSDRLQDAYGRNVSTNSRNEANSESNPRRRAVPEMAPRGQQTIDATRRLTKDEESRIEALVARTVAFLSEEEKTKIASRMSGGGKSKQDAVHGYLRALAVKHMRSEFGVNQKLQSHPDTASNHNEPRRAQNSISDLGTPIADGLPRGAHWYPKSDAFILIGKKDSLVRPLPSGHYNQHNVASNVLIAIGKHPWLPGLNHHLQGQLDRDQSGRQINVLSRQLLRAQELKRYKIPKTMSEIAAANNRATLPMGGKPLPTKV